MIRQRSQSPYSPNKRRKISASFPVPAEIGEEHKLESELTNDGMIDSQHGTTIKSTAVESNPQSGQENGDVVSTQNLINIKIQPTAIENNVEKNQTNGAAIGSQHITSTEKGRSIIKYPIPRRSNDPKHFTNCQIKTLRERPISYIAQRLKLEINEPMPSTTILNEIVDILLHKSSESQEESERKQIPKYTKRPRMSEEVMRCLRDTSGGVSSTSSEPVEEDIHPWGDTENTPIPKNVPVQTTWGCGFTPSPEGLHMRLWCDTSMAKIIHAKDGIISQASIYALQTADQREVAVQNHANYACRKASPFISMTTSPDDISNFRIPYRLKRAKVGEHIDLKLTIVNAHARLAAKLPIIAMLENLEHYDIPCYDNGYIYANEYLLPFRSPPEEIVGQWEFMEMLEWARKNGHQRATDAK